MMTSMTLVRHNWTAHARGLLLALLLGGATTTGRAASPAAAVVSGVVRTPAGLPVPGAVVRLDLATPGRHPWGQPFCYPNLFRVQASSAASNEMYMAAASAADGSYVVSNVAAPAWFVVTVAQPVEGVDQWHLRRYPVPDACFVRTQPGAVTTCQVQFQPPPLVLLHVTDQGGVALSAYSLHVPQLLGCSARHILATSQWVALVKPVPSPLEPRELVPLAYDDTLSTGPTNIALHAWPRTNWLTLVARPSTPFLRGIVRWSDGTPATGILVRTRLQHTLAAGSLVSYVFDAVTDRTGAFALTGLPAPLDPRDRMQFYYAPTPQATTLHGLMNPTSGIASIVLQLRESRPRHFQPAMPAPPVIPPATECGTRGDTPVSGVVVSLSFMTPAGTLVRDRAIWRDPSAMGDDCSARVPWPLLTFMGMADRHGILTTRVSAERQRGLIFFDNGGKYVAEAFTATNTLARHVLRGYPLLRQRLRLLRYGYSSSILPQTEVRHCATDYRVVLDPYAPPGVELPTGQCVVAVANSTWITEVNLTGAPVTEVSLRTGTLELEFPPGSLTSFSATLTLAGESYPIVTNMPHHDYFHDMHITSPNTPYNLSTPAGCCMRNMPVGDYVVCATFAATNLTGRFTMTTQVQHATTTTVALVAHMK